MPDEIPTAVPVTIFSIPLPTILYTVIAFMIGYGGVASATGYRYVLVWDWQAVIAGLIATGLYHAPNFTQPK